MKSSDSTITHFQCSKPPPLGDEDLLTYIDGEPTNEIQEHLDQCVSCSARLDEIWKLEHAIHKTMARIDCPSAETLADYSLRLLNASQIAEIRSHLDDCRRCRNEVELLRTTFGDDGADLEAPIADPREGSKGRVFPKQGAYRERILALQSKPSYGQMKGNLGPQSRIYTSDAASIMLLVEPSAGRLKINGSISDLDTQDRWNTGLVEFTGADAGEPRYTSLIDDDESFMLDKVIPGKYNANFYATDGDILRLRDIEIAE